MGRVLSNRDRAGLPWLQMLGRPWASLGDQPPPALGRALAAQFPTGLEMAQVPIHAFWVIPRAPASCRAELAGFSWIIRRIFTLVFTLVLAGFFPQVTSTEPSEAKGKVIHSPVSSWLISGSGDLASRQDSRSNRIQARAGPGKMGVPPGVRLINLLPGPMHSSTGLAEPIFPGKRQPFGNCWKGRSGNHGPTGITCGVARCLARREYGSGRSPRRNGAGRPGRPRARSFGWGRMA